MEFESSKFLNAPSKEVDFLSAPSNFLAQCFRNFDSTILGLTILSMKNGRATNDNNNINDDSISLLLFRMIIMIIMIIMLILVVVVVVVLLLLLLLLLIQTIYMNTSICILVTIL